MAYTTCSVPAGGKISIQNGKLNVPDQPIIPFIRGDGTGPDIWAASVRVMDAAVAKAYGVAYDQFLPEANLIMGGVAKRSAFVIDKTGIVRYAEVQNHPKDLPDFAAVKETLRGL